MAPAARVYSQNSGSLMEGVRAGGVMVHYQVDTRPAAARHDCFRPCFTMPWMTGLGKLRSSDGPPHERRQSADCRRRLNPDPAAGASSRLQSERQRVASRGQFSGSRPAAQSENSPPSRTHVALLVIRATSRTAFGKIGTAFVNETTPSKTRSFLRGLFLS